MVVGLGNVTGHTAARHTTAQEPKALHRLHTYLRAVGAGRGGEGSIVPPPPLSRSVNPISTRGTDCGRLCPP